MTRIIVFFVLFSVMSMPVFAAQNTSLTQVPETKDYSSPWFTANKSHQYLGLGSLVLGALTAIVPKPEEEEESQGAVDYESSLHYKLAMGATYLGGAALATGLVFHYKDLSLRHLFRNPDNLHAMLATIGALGFLVAVNSAPDEVHVTPGVIGLAGMATAIKITW